MCGAWPPLKACIVFWLIACIACVRSTSAAHPGIYTSRDFGVHALDITGPVTLIDGRNMTLTAHVFVKVRKSCHYTSSRNWLSCCWRRASPWPSAPAHFSQTPWNRFSCTSPPNTYAAEQHIVDTHALHTDISVPPKPTVDAGAPRRTLLCRSVRVTLHPEPATSTTCREAKHGVLTGRQWPLHMLPLASKSEERMKPQPHNATLNAYEMYIHYWDVFPLPYHLAGNLDGLAVKEGSQGPTHTSACSMLA